MKQSKIKHLAAVYMRYKDQIALIEQSEIETFIQDIETAYNKIPYTVSFEPVELNDYNEFCSDIEQKRVLRISSLHNESNLLPALINLKFRAVHDYLHYVLQQPFTFEGEYNVYKSQRLLHSTETGRKILFSEIVLQAAYCHINGSFAPQKVIINF